jgi:hypothetical protein
VSAAKKVRMGRPPLAEEDVRDVFFKIRVSPKERDEIVAAAERDGKPATQWARDVLLATASSPWRAKAT